MLSLRNQRVDEAPPVSDGDFKALLLLLTFTAFLGGFLIGIVVGLFYSL